MRTAKIAAERKKELKKVIRESDRENRTLADNLDALVTDGKADVHVNADTLYNPLSMPENPQLDGEIFNFIEESSNLFAYLVPLRVVLHGVPGGEREQVRTLIRAHYASVLENQLWEKRENTFKAIQLIILGVLMLGVYVALALTRDDSVFLEILSIIGSFAMWEATDCFLLERRAIKRETLKTAQFLSMDVEFAD